MGKCFLGGVLPFENDWRFYLEGMFGFVWSVGYIRPSRYKFLV